MNDPVIAVAEAAIEAKAELREASRCFRSIPGPSPDEQARMAYAQRVEVESFTRLMASEPFTVEGAARMIEAVAVNLRKLSDGQWTLDGQCATYLGHPLVIEVLRRVQEGLETMALQASGEGHSRPH
jgi:hypothetical protein